PAVVGTAGTARREQQSGCRAVARGHGVPEVGGGEREGEHGIAGALFRGQLAVLDLDVPVAAALARQVILHAEVGRYGCTFCPLSLEAGGKELGEELVWRDVLGSCLLGHVGPPQCPGRRPGDRSYCHSSRAAGNRSRPSCLAPGVNGPRVPARCLPRYTLARPPEPK